MNYDCMCILILYFIACVDLPVVFFFVTRKVTQAFYVIMKAGLYYLAGPIMKVICPLTISQFHTDQSPIQNQKTSHYKHDF